jgi:hypothetical protein
MDSKFIVQIFENTVNNICEQAKKDAEFLIKMCKENHLLEDTQLGRKLTENESKIVLCLSRLNAITSIVDYVHINMCQERGLITIYGTGQNNWGQATEIKPSGIEKMTIQLWNGCEVFPETKEQLEGKEDIGFYSVYSIDLPLAIIELANAHIDTTGARHPDDIKQPDSIRTYQALQKICDEKAFNIDKVLRTVMKERDVGK